jgi:PTS system nitrogen regulatory IIA component
MMEVADFLKPDGVVVGLRPANKGQLLRELAAHAAPAVGVNAQRILDALMAREELGSTGVGQGIAVPHARIEGLGRLFGLFVRLEKAIEFAAIDEQPVDLVFLLLIPADAGSEHLAALAAVSRRLRDKDVLRQLGAQKDPHRQFESLVGPGSAAAKSASKP